MADHLKFLRDAVVFAFLIALAHPGSVRAEDPLPVPTVPAPIGGKLHWRTTDSRPATVQPEEAQETPRQVAPASESESAGAGSSGHVAGASSSSIPWHGDRADPQFDALESEPAIAGDSASDSWFHDSNSAGQVVIQSAQPQPLAQVLAILARKAEVNFVDPGIPATETVTYNFDDPNLDPWQAFTQIVQARGYQIIYRGDIVTLVRNRQDPINPTKRSTKRFKIAQGNPDAIFLNLESKGWNQVPYKQLVLARSRRELIATAPEADLDELEALVHSKDFNPHTIKAEIWLERTEDKDRNGLAIEVKEQAPPAEEKPVVTRSLQPGATTAISLLEVQSEQGSDSLKVVVEPVILPNGSIEAELEVENAAASSANRKRRASTARRNTRHTFELVPDTQVIRVLGIQLPLEPRKASILSRFFGRKPGRDAQLILKLSIEDETHRSPRPESRPEPQPEPPQSPGSTRAIAQGYSSVS